MCGRLLFVLVLFYFIFFLCVCADIHLNNVTAVEIGNTFSVPLTHSSTNRSLILISVAAVTLPNIVSDTS